MKGYESRLIRLLLLLFLFAAVVSGCKNVAPVVKIGLVGPFEGKNREIGYDVIYSARMAVREVNREGGIGEYKLAMVALDDFGDPLSAEAMAAALAEDDSIMAVIGHWLPESTDAAAEIYHGLDIPLIAVGEDPFGPSDPSFLPPDFLQAYSNITPFDEVAGPYAGAGYDAFKLAIRALNLAEQEANEINRDSVGRALRGLVHDGLTGEVYAP